MDLKISSHFNINIGKRFSNIRAFLIFKIAKDYGYVEKRNLWIINLLKLKKYKNSDSFI